MTPTARARLFRSDLPLTRKSGAHAVDTEDKALTRYLGRVLQEARSPSLVPPACPSCASRQTILAGPPHARMPMPAFGCNACRRRFNRLTGTPLARLRHADKLPEFVRLLSCQMSYDEAAEILRVDYSAVANWAEKFRTWLLALDPSGRWEARVRLGLNPRPLIACPQCGKEEGVRLAGFQEDGSRRLACRACEVTFALPAPHRGRDLLPMAIAYDPLVTRERRKRAVRGRVEVNPGSRPPARRA